jgi:N-methylhydantoinase B
MSGNKPDSVTITTIWSYFWRVCREMRDTVERTATNLLIVTLHDLAYSIYDTDGNSLAVPEGIPHRLLTSDLTIRNIKKKFAGNIHPGDVFLANTCDDGAVHLPDWVYVRPVFCDNELTFFAVMGVHVADNGGAQPGSNFLAFDNIAEGYNIPLCKIIDKNGVREEIFEMILANNRIPDLMRRESAACVGSLGMGEKRLVELARKYGRDTVLACTGEMFVRAESAVRAQIRSWPDGVWRAEASADGDGKNFGKPVTVRCELTIKGDELFFDYSATDPETDGMLNVHDYMTRSTTYCATFLFLGSELARYHNAGSTRPIHVKTAPGTLVDASRNAKLAAGVALTGCLLIEVICSLLSQALPGKAIAPYSRQITANTIMLGTTGSGVYVTFTPTAGAGAVYGNDGYQCCCAGSTLGNIGKTNIEDEMTRYPWEYVKYEFATDRHGAGRWRGAPGIDWAIENRFAGRCMHQTGSWDGFLTQAVGVQGGEDSPINEAYVLKADGSKEHFAQKDLFTLPGDRLVTVTGGGAGVGNPWERDPASVAEDVKNEIVSVKRAREVYKVAVDPETFVLNPEATAALRGKG